MGRNNSFCVVAVAVVAAVLLTALPPRDVQAQECGDVDNSGAVNATDALLLLRKAVGLNVTLVCAGSGGTTTTTSTTSTTFSLFHPDECFNNSDCLADGFPERFFCEPYKCIECEDVDLFPVPCAEGFVCTAKGICVPAPPRCGDVDHDGAVAATDALLVLRKAVGLNVKLTCAGS